MAEEKIHTVDVVLRYAVTGSKSAAEKRLSEAFRQTEDFPGRIESSEYNARFICADVNPGQVEGYRNYETFSLAVWLKNDRKLYEQCRDVARKVISAEDTAARAEEGDERTPELVMADFIETIVKFKLDIDRREERAKNDAERMFVSLASAALDRVDWLEIAEEWIDDAREG